MLIPQVPLKLIYNTRLGIDYIKILAPICLFQYVQAPLSASLDAMGKSKDNMMGTLIGTILRSILLFTTSLLHIGIYSLIIATSVNVLYVTFQNIRHVRKYLH